MEKIKENINHTTVQYDAFAQNVGKVVSIKGIIHRIREMNNFAFVILRTARETIQCIYSPEFSTYRLEKDVQEGCSVKVSGKVVKDTTRDDRYELQIHTIEILSTPAEPLPLVINKKQLDAMALDLHLNMRPITLRNPKERAIFKIQEGIARGFREYLNKQHFTEIRTPKIVFAGAEGGANIFKLNYFGKQVYLTQSPQFYKQMMIPIYERVFEIAPVFRAEHHDTSRHLNEYISMDFEMGFIDSFYDIMQMETGVLKYIFMLLKEEYQEELTLLNVTMPVIDEIPCIQFKDAKEMLATKFKRKITDFKDFDPEEEQLLGKWAKNTYDSDFLFVTHYPTEKRPFYTMDDKQNVGYTLSFDLLFRGIEITTGGQRIHNYFEQIAKMQAKNMNIADFESYLMLHKYGVPPHGGLGLGLERLTMHLLNFKNIRYASLFPRDLNRVTP